MAIKKFQSPSETSPLFDGDWIFLVVRKRGHVICFWKALSKSFSRIREVQPKTFSLLHCWRPKILGCRKVDYHMVLNTMATKFFSVAFLFGDHKPVLDKRRVFLTVGWRRLTVHWSDIGVCSCQDVSIMLWRTHEHVDHLANYQVKMFKFLRIAKQFFWFF
jgi:hypothetical protein